MTRWDLIEQWWCYVPLRNLRGQETRPHNPIVKYLPTRNADSMSSKESYGAGPSRPVVGQQAHQGISKPAPRLAGQSPFHNTVVFISFIHFIHLWFIHLFNRLFINSSFRSFIHSVIHAFVHSFMHLFCKMIFSWRRWAIRSCIHKEWKFNFFTGFLPFQGASVLSHDAKRGRFFISDAFSSTLTNIC